MGDDAGATTPDGVADSAAGDSAPTTQAAGIDGARDEEGAIHFHFPIDIQIVAGVDSGVVDAVVARVFDELRRELERTA